MNGILSKIKTFYQTNKKELEYLKEKITLTTNDPIM